MTRLVSPCLVLVALVASSVPPAVAAPGRCETKAERVSAGTWQSRPVEGIHAPSEASIAVDEHDPRFVMIGDLSGILVTDDAGCTWKRVADYSDFLSPFEGYTVATAVAGTGADRSLHALVAPWGLLTPYRQPVLLSSTDDGATWSMTDTPLGSGPASSVAYTLASTPGSPGALHLLVVGPAARAAVYAKARTGWRWRSAGLWARPETCVPDGPCTARVLHTLHADHRRVGVLWGLAAGPDDDDAMACSEDGGASWDYRPVPGFAGGVRRVTIAPDGTILLLGDFHEYALSRDGGRSWEVGDVPRLSSSSGTSTGISGVAHFDRSRTFAATLGTTPLSGWAGNVLVFDGRKWDNVSPRSFAGYDRTDEEGRRLTFVELASTRGPLVALSSNGDLMTYRR